MKSKLKRFFLGSFAVFALASSMALSFPARQTFADSESDRLSKELCIFPSISTSSSSPDYHIPSGWLGVEIINRATFKVTFKQNGAHCQNDSNRSINFIDGETPTKPLIDGRFYDEDTSDDIWNFRKRVGSSEKDDSTIDQFDKDFVDDGPFGEQNEILSTADIIRFITDHEDGAEYTIGIEEQALPVECREGSDNDGGDNFQLVDVLNDGPDFIWRCTGGGLRDDAKGYRIGKKNDTSKVFDGKIERFNITYNYDGTKIVHVSKNGGPHEFRACPGLDNKFYTSCSTKGKYFDITKAELDRRIGAEVKTKNSAYDDVVTQLTMKDTNNPSASENVIVAGVNSVSAAETAAAVSQNNTGDDAAIATDPELGCDVQILNPLTWLFCPIVAAANQFIEQMDNAIVDQLKINTQENFGEISDPFATGGKFYQIWSNFRTIGLVILVIAALVMVISQAISVGPFDAYTVKKVMPRIFVAIIFMTLSWQICVFLINLTNDVSIALRAMIQAPFNSVGGPVISGQAGAATIVLGVYAGMGLGILGILSFALTALLAVLIAFFVLTIREMAIIFLVLMAPFAIACYILPNTKKAWDFWWDTFSKALLMFPIIMGMIAIGRVFAAVAASANNESPSLLAQVVVLVAYFGPYFAMPIAFRLAGGAIANISGIANDRSRGAFDRLRNFRKGRSEDRVKKFRSGGLYNTDTWRGRMGNKLGTYMFDPDEKIPYELGNKGVPGFTGRATRLGAEVAHAVMDQSREEAQRINQVGGNDKTGAMLAGAMNRFSDKTRAKLEASDLYEDDLDANGNVIGRKFRGLQTAADWDLAASILEESDDVTEYQGAKGLRAYKGHALNLNREGKGFANLATAGGLIVASHGFMTEQDLVDTGNMIAKTGGSNEIVDTALTQMEVNGAGSGLKVTYSHARDKETGQLITGTQAGRGWDRAMSKSYSDIAGQKKHAVQSDVNELTEIIEVANMTPAQKSQRADQWRRAGMAEDQVQSRLKNVEAKGAAAIDTLQKIIAYNPGSTDNVTIVNQAINDLQGRGINFGGTQAADNPQTRQGPPGSPGGGIPGAGLPPPSGLGGGGIGGAKLP